MSSRYEREVLSCVLDLYKDMPFMWNRSHTDYSDREKRFQGFRDMLQIYKKYDIDASIKTLKKRIENMRTAYLKEFKKVLASKRSGDKEYVPTLWYFNKLNFLNSEMESCPVVVSDFVNVKKLSSDEDNSIDESIPNALTPEPAIKKRKRREILLHTPEEIEKSSENLYPYNELEQWEVFGKYIGMQMRDLTERQRAISQKIISDVIFYAKFDRLAEDSYVVVAPSSEHRSISTDTTTAFTVIQ